MSLILPVVMIGIITCLVIAGIVTSVRPHAVKRSASQEFETAARSCSKEVGEEYETIKTYFEGRSNSAPKNIKCFLRCMLMISNLDEPGKMDDSGKITVAKTIKKADIKQKCVDSIQNEDPCQRAFEFFRDCLREVDE